MPTHASNEEIAKSFKTAKAIAHFDRAWLRCTHKECKTRKTCTGGPRGTCFKSGGIPRCQIRIIDGEASGVR